LKNWRKGNNPLKVAVSATGKSFDSAISPRFGRCPYYVIVNTETMSLEAIPNTNMDAPSGAGIGAAQLVAERGVEAVLTGAVGPNAMAVLSQAGIKMITGAQGNVRQALEALKSGDLKPEPAVGYDQRSFYGRGTTGRGMGMGLGMGRGMRRGMGMGRGMGMYSYQSSPQTLVQPSPTPMAREQEIETLTLQLQQLERQLTEVKEKLEELRK
jgi:predicted Fe-Mo cluster-binding NifX family protein